MQVFGVHSLKEAGSSRHVSLVQNTTEATSNTQSLHHMRPRVSISGEQDSQKSMEHARYRHSQHGSENVWITGDQPDLTPTGIHKDFPERPKLQPWRRLPLSRLKRMYELGPQLSPWKRDVSGERNIALGSKNTTAVRGSSRSWMEAEAWDKTR